MIRCQCPGCAKVYKVPDNRVPPGKKIAIHCPSCGAMIPISAAGTSASSPAEPPKGREAGVDRQIIDSVKDLPAMPQVVIKARNIMADPDSGIQDLTDVIQTDQAIANRLVKLANSAYYGLSGQVSTLQKAAAMLGQKTLNEVLITAGCAGLMDKTLGGYGYDSGEMWRHSIAVATGAKTIAEMKNISDAESAYLAGLVHDSGKLILDPYIQDRKKDFDVFLEGESRTFLSAERHVLGFDHAEIASDVCQKWLMPETILMAVRYHHSPASSGDRPLSYIVHLADHIAKQAGLCCGDDDFLYFLAPGTMDRLGLTEAEVDDVLEMMTETVLSLLAKK